MNHMPMSGGFDMAGRDAAPRDHFAKDNLPPKDQWPDFVFSLPELQYPARLNAVTELLDAHLARGHGEAPCLIDGDGAIWSYAETAARVNRYANALTQELGLRPGMRVLLRAPNNPQMAAVYLAILKAGGVVVATMPLLRAKELSFILRKAKVEIALCDPRLMAEMEKAREAEAGCRVVASLGAPFETLAATHSDEFDAADTASDDVCLIGFTSGTTGEPKATMHFHRDLLAICDSYGRHVLKARAEDRFIGSPPLAFTFGLGGLVLFPLRAGASTVLLEKASPDDLLGAFERLRPTICFTAPTAYRAILAKMTPGAAASLRICVSAGEALPLATFEAWKAATGITIQDGIGATEMLHIFISAPGRSGASRRDRQGRTRLRGQGGRRRGQGPAARLGRPPRGARPHRLPLHERPAPGQLRAGRLEPHRRHLSHG